MAETKDRAACVDEDVIREVLSDVPDSAREAFVQSVTDSDGLDESLWGAAPSRAEVRTAAIRNLQRQFEGRRRLIENSVTRSDAAELLSVSEQAISALVNAGELLTIKVDRELRIPAWQFNPDVGRGFLPGIAQLSATFPGGVTSLSEWAIRPNVDLDDVTPAEALATGRVDAVVNIVRTATAVAW
jgi:hypothetical protein